jgi:hypothetical protein
MRIPANRNNGYETCYRVQLAGTYSAAQAPVASPGHLPLAGRHRCQLAASVAGCLRLT